MSDQSRLFIAAILMMAVLLISWFISGKSGIGPADIPEQQISVPPSVEDTAAEDETVVPEELPPVPDENEYEEKTVTVIIPGEDGSVLVTAEISTTGGAIVLWRLEQYRDFPDQYEGRSVQLSQEPWLITKRESGETELFQYSGPDTLYAGEEPVSIQFTSDMGTKEFSFTENYYGFTVNQVGFDINTSVSAGAIPVTENISSDRGYFGASWYTNGHKKEDSQKIEALEPSGNVSWIAATSKYFTIILMPQSMSRADGYIAPGLGGSPEVSIDDSSVKVFAGPKAYSLLRGLGGSQADMIDFGWPVISWISKLIFIFLKSALSFVGNWGVRIIILAFVLKIMLSPLTTKSYVSMQKMQKIQPAMQEIQKKYAKDPKVQQAEMQKLYKESGVNPIGGCLPIMLQMPVFFAMYRVLANMVELRGAPFFLWINDLSRPEILIPFGTRIMGLEGIGLMAILLGLIMFLQQKLTGTSATGSAAQQQKMMLYIMPLFMTFLFIKFASGLTLYWLVFNVLTFVHQEYIKKKLINE